ncbi:MAG: hypothetical protein RL153_98 [Verrucomicrobiota bacterium]|jgi:FlaA1/EpsC-like NDP-sugar epimerase
MSGIMHHRMALMSAMGMAYGLLGLASFVAAYVLRFDGVIPRPYLDQMYKWCGWAALLHGGALVALGEASAMLGFFSIADVLGVVMASAVSELLVFSTSTLAGHRIPRGVLFVDFAIFTIGVCGLRLALRLRDEWRRGSRTRGFEIISEDVPIAIVGAGECGASLVRDLHGMRRPRLDCVAFFDDDPSKWGHRLHGVLVAGAAELILDAPWRGRVMRVVVADPELSGERLRALAQICRTVAVPIEVLPSSWMEARHRSKVLGLRPLRIEDLLRRPRANSDVDALRGMIRGDVVVVTGAGGTIGGELCRQILAYGPTLLVLVDRSEVQLFEIEQELRDGGAQATVSLHVGDVGDVGEMKAMFQRHRPGIVFHAAAHKHVSFMERQPGEAIRNNVVATALLARAASEAGVGRFVLVSTDKANDPTSVMGASKRVAEMFVQGLHEAHVSPTRFMAVRFGNVLGSSGSVVQVFRRQIAVGGPVTVTHPDATRYFLTIPEAGNLLLQACAIGNGGDVLVLDMGEPVKILDLAREMVELSGRRLGEDIAIQFTGLRPGEKMFEDASHDRDKLRATTHPRIFRLASDPPSLESMDRFLEGLVPLLRDGDDAEIWPRVQSLLAKCGA